MTGDFLPKLAEDCFADSTCLIFSTEPIMCMGYVTRCVFASVGNVTNLCAYDLAADFTINVYKYGFDLNRHDWFQYMANIYNQCASYNLDLILNMIGYVLEYVDEE